MAKKNKKKSSEFLLTEEDLRLINSKDGILELLGQKEYNLEKALETLRYEEELKALQGELIKLQQWAIDKQKRLLIIIEGRDAAGKGGTIQRFTKTLMPRFHRVVALSKPNEKELGEWYFQRFVHHLPTNGEIVFFDRSWYNRAVVEPVNGFCTKEQHEDFMKQVNDFEKMLIDSGLIMIKLFLNTSKEEQASRFNERKTNPQKQWKIGPVDAKAQDLWDRYSHYIERMLAQTHSKHAPWVVVQADNKKPTRLETIRYVLNSIDYEGKNLKRVSFEPNREIIRLAPEWNS